MKAFVQDSNNIQTEIRKIQESKAKNAMGGGEVVFEEQKKIEERDEDGEFERTKALNNKQLL